MCTCDGALWRAPFRKFWIQFLSHVWQILCQILDADVMWIFLTGCYCLGVMIWTSGYTISVLHRHKQQVQHIHSNGISPDLPMVPEPHTSSWSWWASSTFNSLFHFYSFCCYDCKSRPVTDRRCVTSFLHVSQLPAPLCSDTCFSKFFVFCTTEKCFSYFC